MNENHNTPYRARPGRPPKWRTEQLRAISSKVFYDPNERQKLFHSCPADVVGYGGAVGGGKSLALVMDALAHTLDFPGAHALLMRRSYPELEGSLILRSREMYPPAFCQYNEIKHWWKVENKKRISLIEFGFCRLEKDRFKYQSREFSYLGIDEATHFPWSIVSYMISRARTSMAGRRVQIRFGTNPGNIGHAWFKRYFGIGNVLPETVWKPEPDEFDPNPLTRCFIPAKVQDNTALMKADPNYLKRLMLLPVTTRKRLLEGNWETPEGIYFTEFGEATHVIKPFPIPRHWKFYRSVDYGYDKPFSCHWYTMSPDGHCYCIRELYKSGLRDVQQAEAIKKVSAEPVEYTMSDPSMRNKNSSGKSAAEEYMNAGVPLIPADNNRVAGWMAVRNYLAPMADGKPGIQFFDTCPNIIRELKDAIHDETNPEDVDTTISDHAIDDLRYFCSSRPVTPDVPVNDPYGKLDEASRREWERYDKECKRLTEAPAGAILNGLHESDDSL